MRAALVLFTYFIWSSCASRRNIKRKLLPGIWFAPCGLTRYRGSRPFPWRCASIGNIAESDLSHKEIANMIAEEMKGYEAETCNSVVNTALPVVVRLDGHCFHTYTKEFKRPYDERIVDAMVLTSIDLLDRFQALTAYTESDEISLIFAPGTEESVVLPFTGRVQKIVSVVAGYASARFNFHMLQQSFHKDESALRDLVERSEAHFDARVFAVPSLERLIAYMRWRAVMDCRRNSINMLAHCYFPQDKLHRVDARTCVAMLKEQKGVNWEDTPAFFRYGSFVKKEEYFKKAFNRKLQEEVTVRRTRATSRSFAFDEKEAKQFLLAAIWPGEGPGPGVESDERTPE